MDCLLTNVKNGDIIWLVFNKGEFRMKRKIDRSGLVDQYWLAKQGEGMENT